jgi:inner membrane protein
MTEKRRFAVPGTVARLLGVVLLTLLLMIPLGLIRGVVAERARWRDQAVADITGTWGGEQEIFGPVLSVPYRYLAKVQKSATIDGVTTVREVLEPAVAVAHFLPRELSAEGTMEPTVLHRGLYRTPVYRAALHLRGTFARPIFDDWKIPPDDILWDEATLGLGLTGLRGVNKAPRLAWGGRELTLVSGSTLPACRQGVTVRLPKGSLAPESIPFDLELDVNGSSRISIYPLGDETTARLSSPWPDPSFGGAFLPRQRTVTGAGFEAAWQVSGIVRPFPARWTSQDGTTLTAETIREGSFSVSLLDPVDAYRLSERSVKYGLLFVVLVFTSFFLFEATVALRVHPIQYAMVGAALCLFYLLLVALSEIVPFGAAYAAGAVASAGLITLYTRPLLRRPWMTGVVGAELGIIYGFLYVVLRLQDYSLIIGAAGLFLALAVVMFVTRRIDWYRRDAAE